MKRNTSNNELLENMKYGCTCKNNCLDRFTIREMKSAISIYSSKKGCEKTQWLLDILHILFDEDSDKVNLKIRGKDVCIGGFCSFYGITYYKYFHCLNRIRSNNLVVIHGNSEREYRTYQTDLCSTFLDRYCSTYGEQQPDSDEIHCPHSCLKIDLYQQFKNDCTEIVVPHPNTFLTVWRQKYPHLKIPKNSRLGKCDICVSLQQEKLLLTHSTKSAYQLRKREHLQIIVRERFANSNRIVRSFTYPFSTTVLGIDRMNALQLPQQHPYPKSWMTKNRLRYEVISVFDAADRSRDELYHGLKVFPNDCNTTLTVLYLKIRSLRAVGALSPKLIFHMDNCWRENKNRYVFAFCCLLVYKKWISECEIFFLPPGHTHAENDCMFVPIGKGKKRINCNSPPHFTSHFIPKCYARHKEEIIPTLKKLQFVFLWKQWLSPHIRPIRHHSPHRAFQFKLDGNNNVVMFFKNSPLDQNWIGYHTTYGYQLMSSFPNNNSCPITQIPIEIPKEDLKDIPSMLEFMESNDRIWWEKFMEDQTILNPTEEDIEMVTNEFWNFHNEPLHLDENPLNVEEPPPLIQVDQHPTVAPQLSKGSLVAVIAAEDDWSFWIGEVYNITEVSNQTQYHIHYYEQLHGIWRRMSRKAVGSVGTCTIGSILVSNFQFTKGKKLTKSVSLQIKKKIDELKNLESEYEESLEL